ncbi:MAG: beta-N-acetylhexosaminidase [Chitinophagales bacterium]
MMKSLFTILLTFQFFFSFSQPYSIIPQPVSIIATEGHFAFNRNTYIVANDIESFKDATVFNQFMVRYFQFPIKTFKKPVTSNNYIEVSYNPELKIPDEGYILKVENNKISIQAKNKGGILNGFTTLFQLFAYQKIHFPTAQDYKIPCCEITDYPRFHYRGMHLDCARHFFDLDFIRKYIDYLAMYKYNTFHWHLTDDQGWRIEIKQYPKLTEIGAWRDGSMVGHYREQQFDSIRYGGFYTQAEIKQIVKYAADRNITVIPEIEMPGHCLAALAAYPELGCVNDTSYAVAKAWGVHPDVFCPKEETFTFLENVLDEVMAIFPSEYIHIGGDEVEKIRWKNSDFCQQLMKENNLKDEHELQSFFIQRIEKYVNSKGRKIIGWDEILEGGLAPNATIMSWRGEDGGIAAAQQSYYAVMTPGSHCYFDHYQGSPANEPLAIGGFTPIEKVYDYEPIPAQLTVEQAKYILGAQANVWTEYITTPEKVEYMAIPRMLALSEVLWSSTENKNYDDFVLRLLTHFKLLDEVNCKYSKSIFNISYKIYPTEDNNGVIYALNYNKYFGDVSVSSAEYLPSATIQTHLYTEPILVTIDQVVSAKYKNGINKQLFTIHVNKATGKKITLTSTPSKKYAADGAFTLVNGIVATTKPNWAANEWLGFEGTDCEAIIDLGKTDTISKITVGYLEDKLSWIWLPASISLETSIDRKTYSQQIAYAIDPADLISKRNYSINLESTAARFIKLTIKNFGVIPAGYPGAGNMAWLFVDEISIE